jgi:hypothetical protein
VSHRMYEEEEKEEKENKGEEAAYQRARAARPF